MSTTVRSAAALVLVVALLAATAPAAGQTADEPVFEIALNRDGSARVTLTLAFDLTTDADKRAFETLREDTKAKADVKARFRDRLRSVANQSERTTGREMRVYDAAVNLTTTDGGGTGIVALSVAWDGLAAVIDGHLIVTEPFASGYTPDRKFVVRIDAPEGYRLTAARPTPSARGNASVVWDAGTDLGGFRVAFSPAEQTPLSTAALENATGREGSPATRARTGGQPGFGALLAILALLASVLLAVAGRSR